MNAAALLCLLGCCCGCATPRAPAGDAPVHWTIAHAQRGSHCGDSVRIDEGHAPLDAVSLGDVMMTASARPLEAYRTVLRAIAHDRCAQGAVLLRADEDARGVVSVHARLWDNATQPPAATP